MAEEKKQDHPNAQLSNGRYSLTILQIQDKLELNLRDKTTKYTYQSSFDSHELQKCGFSNTQVSNLESVSKFIQSAKDNEQGIDIQFDISIENTGSDAIITITRNDDFFPMLITLRLKQSPIDKVDILEQHILDLQTENKQLKKLIVPKGSIVMWSGNANEIPDGWMLCDGNNGTPDLRNRFIMGCGQQMDVGDFGGSEQHHHNINIHGHQLTVEEIPEHYHKSVGFGFSCVDNLQWGAGTQWGFQAYDDPNDCNMRRTTAVGGNQSHSHNNTCDNASSLPPYIVLAFIIKIA